MTYDWIDHAACRGVSVEQFFVNEDDRGPGVGDRKEAAALRYCKRCPVVGACLDDALDKGDTNYGIRGGLNPKDRKAEHRRRLRKAAA